MNLGPCKHWVPSEDMLNHGLCRSTEGLGLPCEGFENVIEVLHLALLVV